MIDLFLYKHKLVILICFGLAEGPCLVHTITGDLLRALEGPDNYQLPRVISVSSEGHCIIYYERGCFCNFSINGKLLAQMEVNDSTRVNDAPTSVYSTKIKNAALLALD